MITIDYIRGEGSEKNPKLITKNLNSPYALKMKKKELCQQCGGSYKTSQLLRIHFQVTHNEDCVKCKECNEVFQGKKKLYNHKTN